MSALNPEPCRKASVEILALDNGFVFHFTDETNWKHSKTVHESADDARRQLKKFVAVLEHVIDSAEKRGHG